MPQERMLIFDKPAIQSLIVDKAVLLCTEQSLNPSAILTAPCSPCNCWRVNLRHPRCGSLTLSYLCLQ